MNYYTAPGVSKNLQLADLIEKIEEKFSIIPGSIKKRLTGPGKPRKIGGKTISIYRAALAQNLKVRGLLHKDIAPLVGVKDHAGVCALLGQAEAHKWNNNEHYKEVSAFIFMCVM
jgi:hypothetical protein